MIIKSCIFFLRYSNLDGSNRHTILEGQVPHPFAITIFEEWMYWTDWNHKSVEKANRFTGENREILKNTTHRPMDIQIFHPLRQPLGSEKEASTLLYYSFVLYSYYIMYYFFQVQTRVVEITEGALIYV